MLLHTLEILYISQNERELKMNTSIHELYTMYITKVSILFICDMLNILIHDLVGLCGYNLTQ